MALLLKIGARGESLLYRVAGLPVALQALFTRDARSCGDIIRRGFAYGYWHPKSRTGYLDIALAAILWPIVLIVAPLWFTARNGPLIREREKRGLAAQLRDQVRLYFTDGVVAPWYYIFELYGRSGAAKARDLLHRYQTKAGFYHLLRRGVTSELNDKKAFADYCAANGVPCIAYLLYFDGVHVPDAGLPGRDLFVKRVGGRGGRGAERWDFAGTGEFVSQSGERLTSAELFDRLARRSRDGPLLLQGRAKPHPAIAELTSGALSTVRATTCLDEKGEPEVVAALFRTSIGSNQTVDNIHAGGLGASIDLATGTLGKASNLGMDATLGWVSRHPDTGAEIEGRKLPLWEEVKALAVQAHRAFSDRVLVGWDIAITDRGPVVVEGNSSPDVDIVQRFGVPACRSRFGELIAWHLRKRGFA